MPLLTRREKLGSPRALWAYYFNNPDLGSPTDNASEKEQCFVRVALGVVCFALAYIASAVWTTQLRWLFTVFAVDSILLLAWNYMQSMVLPSRRIFGIFNDISATTLGLHLMDVHGLGLISIYLFVTHGNAFRYGEPYFWVSYVLSVTGVIWVWAHTEFWLTHTSIAIGALLSIVIVPFYTMALLRRVRRYGLDAAHANSAKSRLIASISHEMRTSLASISGGTDLLLKTSPSTTQHELLNVVATSSRALNTLIQDVLDLSKIEQAKIVIAATIFDVHNMLASLFLLFHRGATGRNIALDLWISPGINPFMYGDAPRVRQVLINLVGNSIKFTEDGGSVSVTIERGHASPNSVLFKISDTGIGIPASVQSRIFDAFTQGDQTTTRKYGGSGLGTTIAKQLVELMGGRIWFDSRVNEGTTFYFEIPLTPATDTEAIENNIRPITIIYSSSAIHDALQSFLAAKHGQYNVELIALDKMNQGSPAQLTDDRPVSKTILLDKHNYLDDLSNTFNKMSAAHLVDTQIVITNPDVVSTNRVQPNVTRMPFAPELWLRQARFNDAMVSAQKGLPDNVTSSLDDHQPRTRGRIMLAEDNPLVQKVTAAILRSDGHDVVVANDGMIGLRLLQERTFDLAVVDYHMPEMDGMNLIKAYRATESGCPIPIIMLTASVSKETAESALLIGATQFIMKPYNTNDLLAAIQSFLRPSPVTSVAPIVSSSLTNTLFDSTALDALLQLGTASSYVREIISDFRTSAVAFMAQLEKPQVYQDAHLKTLLHNLAGVSGTVGGTDLANYCRSLSGRKDNIITELSEIIPHVQALTNATLACLDKYEATLHN